MTAFLLSAFPWLIAGVSIGVLAVNLRGISESFDDGKNVNDTFIGDGLTAGMLFGVSAGMFFSLGLLYTVSIGSLAGAAFGSCFRKRKR